MPDQEPTPQTSTWSGPRTKLLRHPERGNHDSAQICAIIDEALIVHVAFEADGAVMTLPTAHARIGDHIYLHGAVANRMLRSLCARGSASLTFTLLDGLVLARTAFHHSMNFRSVVVFGSAAEVSEPQEKRAALHALIEQLAPGRMRELSEPTAQELSATLVVRVTIEQASCKARSGPPLDAASDMALDVWAGTIALQTLAHAPVADPQLRADQTMSEAATKRALGFNTTQVESAQRGEYLFSTDPRLLQLTWVHTFLRDDSYWAVGLNESAFRAALAHSVTFGVYHAERQVAFARVLTDDTRIAYLGDVFVAESYRGRGLGKQLVQFVLDHPRVRQAKRCLLGTRDAHSLYERFGFQRAEDGRYMLRWQ
jgi:nitroimidazol reductase NimA-like FMN-containing flavoprotein (pyridoxamine 5'-phosphate oxidase superfamily)/GNAT superfamily N-acetyltransferase